jgi:trehalose 6-phosphate phosphatase
MSWSRTPAEAAIMLDVDGTLAPIVARPELARVPDETRAELRRLVARYALVACISGRTGADARKIVGVDGPVYVGVHGLELAPEAERWRGPLREFAESVDWPVEDKGLAVVFHYRGAEDEEAALGTLRGVADRATALGLRAQFGRKVLEVRPPVAADKGTAVRALLEQRRLRRALYAAMTRPTSTPSGASTGSTSRCASRSRRPKGRRSSARPRTSWSRARPSWSRCFAASRRGGAPVAPASGAGRRRARSAADRRARAGAGRDPLGEPRDLAEVDEVAAVDPRKASRG